MKFHGGVRGGKKTSTVPKSFKQASITPLLKKTSLDRNVLKNYCPVSNLPFLSKILEKVVSKTLSSHRANNSLNVPLQSAYRQHHSTDGWMDERVLGHFFALSRLNWAGDNLD